MEKTSRVVEELKRRAARGHPLNSGANRGDWPYAAAVLAFGSWEHAVEAAGFACEDIKIRPVSKQEVIARLKELSASGEPILSKTQESKLGSAAIRHFGSWREATTVAGGVAGPTKWTPQRVLEAIRADHDDGLPLNSVAVVKRNLNLYAAGRRRFGTWAAALEAATGQADPVVALLRAERRQGLYLTSGSVRRRNLRLHTAAVARFGSWEAAIRAAFEREPTDVKASAKSGRRR